MNPLIQVTQIKTPKTQEDEVIEIQVCNWNCFPEMGGSNFDTTKLVNHKLTVQLPMFFNM